MAVKYSTQHIVDNPEDIDEEPEVLIWGAELAKHATADFKMQYQVNLKHENLKCGVSSVDCGHGHVLISTNDGRVLAYGLNDFSQCGINTSNSRIIRQLTLIVCGEHATHVTCGHSFSLIATQSGVLYGCGKREFLGIRKGPARASRDLEHTALVPIGPFLNQQTVGVTTCATRGEYSCVSSGCDLWHFGYCRFLARLLRKPEPLDLHIEGTVQKISLGVFFGALLTSHSKVYVWGDGTYGEMGGTLHSCTPVELADPMKEGFLDIACGDSHTLLVARDGTLKVIGDNSNSQLGAESFTTQHGTYTGKRVYDLASVKTSCPFSGFPVTVFAGSLHSGMLTNKRRLYLWGSNTNGKLGNFEHDPPLNKVGTSIKSPNEKVSFPYLCYRLLHRRIETVAMKGNSTVVICGPESQTGASSAGDACGSDKGWLPKRKTKRNSRAVITDCGITQVIVSSVSSV